MTFYRIIFLILIFTITSCGTINVTTKPNTKFSSNSNFTVKINQYSDPIGLQSKLENLLLSRGFKVVSDWQVGQLKDVNSLYKLRITYKEDSIWFFHIFSNFSASVLDINEGDIVLALDFQGERFSSGVLEYFVDELSNLKESEK